MLCTWRTGSVGRQTEHTHKIHSVEVSIQGCGCLSLYEAPSQGGTAKRERQKPIFLDKADFFPLEEF